MDRIGRNTSYANVAATLALVLAMSGGAVAATGGFSSNGTLRACANEEGVIRLLKAGKHCKRGQKAVSWNRTGPVGAKGATGAAGPAGATGAAGERGSNVEGTSTSWAAVTEQGTLENGQRVVNSELRAPGNYLVTFDHDVSKCSVVATSNVNSSVRIVASILRLSGDRAAQAVIATRNLETKEVESTPFSVVADC